MSTPSFVEMSIGEDTLPCDIEISVSPEEKQTWDHPGYEEEIEIQNIMVKDVDIQNILSVECTDRFQELLYNEAKDDDWTATVETIEYIRKTQEEIGETQTFTTKIIKDLKCEVHFTVEESNIDIVGARIDGRSIADVLNQETYDKLELKCEQFLKDGLTFQAEPPAPATDKINTFAQNNAVSAKLGSAPG